MDETSRLVLELLNEMPGAGPDEVTLELPEAISIMDTYQAMAYLVAERLITSVPTRSVDPDQVSGYALTTRGKAALTKPISMELADVEQWLDAYEPPENELDDQLGVLDLGQAAKRILRDAKFRADAAAFGYASYNTRDPFPTQLRTGVTS